MKIQSYKELIVWQKAFTLAELVYQLTEQFPEKEKYGLASQMRRAAVSIPSNIAEGKKRGTRKDFVRFLRIADGSVAELETQVLLAKEFYPAHDFLIAEGLISEIQKMLTVMVHKLSADYNKTTSSELSAPSSKL